MTEPRRQPVPPTQCGHVSLCGTPATPLDAFRPQRSNQDWKADKMASGALDERDDVGAGRVGAEVQARRLELVQLPQQTQLQLRAGTPEECAVAAKNFVFKARRLGNYLVA